MGHIVNNTLLLIMFINDRTLTSIIPILRR